MRDYFIHPSQTNLELYAQAIEHGYAAAERRDLADAYHLALLQVFPLARGSGKPFIAHLVGTASLVMESGCSPDLVLGALLHALYQRRIPFQDGTPPDDRRWILTERFGVTVDDIVHRYTSFESENLRHHAAGHRQSDADVLTLRLADELEDVCGYALALHGSESSDASSARGGYAWRRETKSAERSALLALAGNLNLDGIARGLSHWLDFNSVPEELNDMRTGWFSSVNLAMASE